MLYCNLQDQTFGDWSVAPRLAHTELIRAFADRALIVYPFRSLRLPTGWTPNIFPRFRTPSRARLRLPTAHLRIGHRLFSTTCPGRFPFTRRSYVKSSMETRTTMPYLLCSRPRNTDVRVPKIYTVCHGHAVPDERTAPQSSQDTRLALPTSCAADDSLRALR